MATLTYLYDQIEQVRRENQRLAGQLAEAMALLREMPVKHPQQGERRAALIREIAHLL